MTRVLNLFRRGFDTAQIAAIRNVPESEIDRILTAQICADRGLPVPETCKSLSVFPVIGSHLKSSSG